jgi:hypothetical protein
MPSLGGVKPARQRFFTELAAGWHEVASRRWAWVTLIGIAGPLEASFGADKVLVAAALVAVAASAIPAMLPAVRAVIRHQDGTITGPPLTASAQVSEALDPR